MKKIFALCSVVVCFALIITVFTACGDSKDETATSTTASNVLPSAVNGDFLFTAEVKEDSVVIKNNGEEYQTLKYPQNSGTPFDLEYAKAHAEFIDMNFDGQPDFYIATASESEVVYYFCWLFNATSKQFDFSVSLSGLTNISVDSDKQIIYSTIKTGDNTKVVSYGWVDGQLTYKDIFDDTSDTIPEDVKQSAENNSIGSVTKPVTTESNDSSGNKSDGDKSTNGGSSSTSKTTQSSGKNPDKGETVTKEDKPLNTTTTEPATGGIMVETGNIDDGWF